MGEIKREKINCSTTKIMKLRSIQVVLVLALEDKPL